MISPHSEQLGASCWYRNVPCFAGLTPSAFFAGITNPTIFSAVATGIGVAVDTLSMNDRSEAFGLVTFEDGVETGVEYDAVAASSRRITPACSCASRLRNLLA